MKAPKDTNSIKLNLADKLQDEAYRRAFFRLRTQDNVAEQIRGMRGLRELKQKELAELCGMKQSAISRIEQADYESWTLNTILRVADALGALVKVEFEPKESVINRLKRLEEADEPSYREDSSVSKYGDVPPGSTDREYMANTQTGAESYHGYSKGTQ